jgi:hypothetical protein
MAFEHESQPAFKEPFHAVIFPPLLQKGAPCLPFADPSILLDPFPLFSTPFFTQTDARIIKDKAARHSYFFFLYSSPIRHPPPLLHTYTPFYYYTSYSR